MGFRSCYFCFVFLLLSLQIFIQEVESVNETKSKNLFEELQTNANSTILTKIAFGSCNKHVTKTKIWNAINDFEPQLWLWLGDSVYADIIKFPLRWEPAPPNRIQDFYDSQKQVPEYSKLIQSIPISGIWDDHDYGLNNGGKSYIYKKESQKLFLEFLNEPKNSPRWNREGVYGSFIIGPTEKSIHFILLDVRYFMDEDFSEDSDLLGTAQWNWLEEELKVPSTVKFIGSGIQVIPSDKLFIEKWYNFPKSRTRLFTLLGKYSNNTQVTILLSGDVHHSETLVCKNSNHLIYEFTSSGITHTCSSTFPFCNFLLKNLLNTQYRLDVYNYYNFGVITIDWNAFPFPILSLITKNENGSTVAQRDIEINRERLLNSNPTALGCNDFDNQPTYMRYPLHYFVTGLYIIFFSLITFIILMIYCCCCRKNQSSNVDSNKKKE